MSFLAGFVVAIIASYLIIRSIVNRELKEREKVAEIHQEKLKQRGYINSL
jgi:hypothetical protein